MGLMMDVLEKKHAILVTEFDRYVINILNLRRRFLRMLRLFSRWREMMSIMNGVGS